ncbi:MAG TPA: ribonuclease III [Candidatus Jacksonbacteria bacterium]|nr:ribonuclease III [Candidatus Jacksonbacteria bacterium]HCE86821.1 ribonuclease III [Candidatus Jacksonbacteria bacterium]
MMNILSKMKDLSPLEKKLSIRFNNNKLLTQALVHKSYINENPHFPLDHNERLEFLGDAVLELAVTEYLFKRYPRTPEGEMTNWRASLVNATMLGTMANEFDLYEHLFLSKGERKDQNQKARQYILANAFEALIGAIYIDQGMDTAREFVERNIISKLPDILKNQSYLDAKTRFQETAQEKAGVTPTYKVLNEKGPDHEKHFTIGVYLGEECVANGNGFSKQEAQMDAAAKALQVKGWE